jgi:hypothetical protein
MIFKIKRFARADYEGLSKTQKKLLKRKRGDIAKELLKKRSENNKKLLAEGKEALWNNASVEHHKFVDDGILRKNWVSSDKNGNVVTRNIFGKKKVHTDPEIMERISQGNFVWEKSNRADSHKKAIDEARKAAKNAKEKIIKEKGSKAATEAIKEKGSEVVAAATPTVTPTVKSVSKYKNPGKYGKYGKYGLIAAGTLAAAGTGYGLYRRSNKEERALKED